MESYINTLLKFINRDKLTRFAKILNNGKIVHVSIKRFINEGNGNFIPLYEDTSDGTLYSYEELCFSDLIQLDYNSCVRDNKCIWWTKVSTYGGDLMI